MGQGMIDLNCDMGEGFGAYRLEVAPAVLERITSANLACGYHAGDPRVMEASVRLCKDHGVAVGAHPGLPDLMGFGRREMRLHASEARDYVLYQVGALKAFCDRAGIALQHVKAHGALYNMAVRDEDVAGGIVEAVASLQPQPILVALAGSPLARLGEEAGLRVCHEAFADRAYHADGTLVGRTREGALLHDPVAVARRVLGLVSEGTLETVEGTRISLRADSLCVHGDNPQAVAIVVAVADLLEQEGIRIVPMDEIVPEPPRSARPVRAG